MQSLKVIGTENESLIVVAADGTKFLVPIDDVLRSQVRRVSETPSEKRASPREIQALIRSGMSAREVAEKLNTSLERVLRFEPPVIAEIGHIVASALSTPVNEEFLFGEFLEQKLAELGGQNRQDSAWRRDDSEWFFEVRYSLGDKLCQASWSFDRGRGLLHPVDAEALRLSPEETSSQTDTPEDKSEEDFAEKSVANWDSFNSDLFNLPPLEEGAEPPAPPSDLAVNRLREETVDNPTEKLLESLRRKRQTQPEQENEVKNLDPVTPYPSKSNPSPVQGYLRAIDPPECARKPAYSESKTPKSPKPGNSKKTRPNVPSWDEILFGAKKPESGE